MLAAFALAKGMDKEHIFIMLIVNTTVIGTKASIKMVRETVMALIIILMVVILSNNIQMGQK